MTFDKITDNEHLWAVRYDEMEDNVFSSVVIDKWYYDV